MRIGHRAAWSLGVGLVLAAGPALAQEGGDLAEVVVTGSRAAPRIAAKSAAPVDAFSGEELTARGYSDLSRALQFVAPSLNFPRAATAPSAASTRGATLRGLTPDQVLVLVNGKRWHASSVINFNNVIGRGSVPVDLNLIPMAAVERVEILRDGAAAQYGSDAIAGVINIILRDEAAGGEAAVQAGATSQGDGETFIASMWRGFTLPRDGSLTLTGEVRKRSPTNRAAIDRRYGRVTNRQGDPDSLDASLAAALTAPVSDGLEVYGDAILATRASQSAPQFRTPSVAPVPYPAGFLPLVNVDILDLGGTLGVRGQAGTWAWDLSDTYGYNRADFDVSRTTNTSLGLASPSAFDAGGATYAQNLLNLNATRRFDLMAGANLALGVEHRYEAYEIRAGEPGSLTGAGAQGLPGFNPPSPVDVSRNALSAYVDGELELTDGLRLGAAVRYEDYDDFGDQTTGKLSAFAQVLPTLALRATASTGFRAPSLQQQFFATVTSQSSAGVLVNVGTFGVDDPVSRALGAQPLKPETSINYSVGLVWTPIPDLTVTADAFRVEIEDRIALSESLQGPLVAAILQRAGVTNASQVRFFANAFDTTTEGFDVTATWRRDLGDHGRATFTGAYSSVDTDIDAMAVNRVVPSLPLMGLSSIDLATEAQPRNKLVVSADWRGDRLGARLDVTRFGAFRGVFAVAEQVYGASTTVDLSLDWRMTDALTVRGGVLNMTDEYPDKAVEAALVQGGSLQYGETGGLGVDGREFFVGVKASF